MSREAECRKRIETVKEAYDMLGAKPEAVMCDLLTDIALSLAQIADRLNGVILTNETSKFGWEELGGKGGE